MSINVVRADTEENIVCKEQSPTVHKSRSLIELDNGRCRQAQNRWARIRNTLHVVKSLKSPEIEVVGDVQDLHKMPPPVSAVSSQVVRDTLSVGKALKGQRHFAQLFSLAANGHVSGWQEEYQSDASRFLFDGNSSHSALNQYSSSGLTQLHIAAQNGHVDMCNILLKLGANHLSPTKFGFDQKSGREEVAIEIASRWGHSAVVELLLNHAPHPHHILKKAYKCGSNDRVQNCLYNQLKQQTSSFCLLLEKKKKKKKKKYS
eukprot:Platyproteum_vivax@DN3053_c0_g1_i1.p1